MGSYRLQVVEFLLWKRPKTVGRATLGDVEVLVGQC